MDCKTNNYLKQKQCKNINLMHNTQVFLKWQAAPLETAV